MDVFSKVSYLSACSQRCGRSTKRKDSSREKGRGLEDEPEKDDSDAPSPCSCWSRLFIVHIIWEQLQTSSSCPTFLPGILLLLGLRFSSSFCSSGYVRRMHRWTRFGVVGGHPTTPLCSFGHFFPSYSYILRRGKFNYRMRIFLLVFISLRFFFFFVFSSFPLRIFFFVSAESIPRRTFSVSAFICCWFMQRTPHSTHHPHILSPPWAARSVKQSTSTSTSPPRPHPHSRSDSDSDPERCWIFAKYADWIFSSWLNDIKDICQASATAFAPASRLRLLKPMSSMIFLAYRTLESADYI